jgi:dihydroorotase
MKPPLRASEDAEAVIEGLVSGAVDAIATDHAPHAGDDKMQEFEKCPFGIIGLETAVGTALEVLLHPGRVGLTRLIALFTAEPARVIGWQGEQARGALKTGYAGDVTVLDLKREWTYDVNRSYSKSKNSPFDGHTFRGGPVATIVGGEIVWRREDD